ncbi:MAG TPA: glycine--tRNA ligase subunit beta [Spirochaetia bacterium]|nr:glycine--tRNA ligase subunit beta [Spirochaetia bacterium]
MATFLLEIGTEEMPARFISAAMASLSELAQARLAEERLICGPVRTAATPRRLALLVEDLPDRQPPLVREVKGPAAKAAFDEDGRPTRAGAGFAKSQGVRIEDLVVRPGTHPKGGSGSGTVDYVFAIQEKAGRPLTDVLRDVAPALITSLSFPKPMRWGSLEFPFIRPIRWLVALLDDAVVDFELAGCRAGRRTYGHRVLGRAVELAHAAQYFERLREIYVIADVEERRETILRQIHALAGAAGGSVREDPDLLEEVNNLVEYPTALAGRIEEEYLSLPRAVLITSMREHQRYFPVEMPGGSLAPLFITVRNGSADHLDTVRTGNERVLRARLADAAFFYREDLRQPLESRVEDLRKIVYLEGLGTLYDRTRRIGELAGKIAGAMSLTGQDLKHLERAATLAKADLTTAMVYEFTELQGTMGREYATAGGEHPAVAQAIYEHYLPRFAGDELPASPAGCALALADKLDHVAAIFSQNLLPSGSQDPYALRRQALGVCHIVLAGDFHLSLSRLVAWTFEGLAGFSFKLEEQVAQTEVLEFFRSRVRGLFLERGLSYDTVEAVLSYGCDDIADVWARAAALQDFRAGQEFTSLMAAYARPHHLSKDAPAGRVNPSLFRDPAEEDLYRRCLASRMEVERYMAGADYGRALGAIAGLAGPVDNFFNAVMVMVDDPELKQNRLALLQEVAALTASVADLSRLAG